MGFRAIRGMIACLCCLLLAGPILIFVGIAMLVAPNNRGDEVGTYNAAVGQYQLLDARVMQGSNGTLSNVWGNSGSSTFSGNLVPQTVSIVVEGDLDGVAPATSTVLQTPSASVTGSFSAMLINNVGINSTLKFPAAPATQNLQISVKCTSNNYCSSSRMASLCQAASGCNNAVWLPSSGCSSQSTCSGCSYTLVPKYICYQISPSVSSGWANTISSAAGNPTCDYPFNTQPMVCPSSGSTGYVPFTLRSSTDPYITLSRVTKGKMNFGLTSAQQRGIGFGLAVVGGLLIAGLLGMCILMKNARSSHEHRARIYDAFGRTYQYPAGYQPLGQGMAPTQAPYQQQQPQPMAPAGYGYGQPPAPVYAAQPAPYGQPPQQQYYGQPAPGYGQPVQAMAYNQPPQQGVYGAPGPQPEPYKQY